MDTPPSSQRYKDLNDTDASEEESDVGDSIAPVSMETFEQLEREGEGLKVGGIEISKALRKIQARDKIDRRYERERIRALHRERRLKRRKHAKSVDQEGEDDGSCGLALLATADSDLATPSSESSDEGPLESTVGRKRQRKKEQGPRSNRQVKKRSEEQLGTCMDSELAEDEQLAKHLLGI